jgi:hypothetical protein
MQLQMTFDLEVNGYSRAGFEENPASAMHVMLERALEFIDGQNLFVFEDKICTPMGQPIATLEEDR